MLPRELLSIIRAAAYKAGEAAVRAREEEVGGEAVGVGRSGDTTLRGDLEAERAAVEYISGKLDDAVIVSEEMGAKTLGKGGVVVVIDPIDGSRNYKRGSPLFTVSIAAALGETLEEVVAGVVYAPVLGFEAVSYTHLTLPTSDLV